MRGSDPAEGLLLMEALASRNRSLKSVWVKLTAIEPVKDVPA